MSVFVCLCVCFKNRKKAHKYTFKEIIAPEAASPAAYFISFLQTDVCFTWSNKSCVSPLKGTFGDVADWQIKFQTFAIVRISLIWTPCIILLCESWCSLESCGSSAGQDAGFLREGCEFVSNSYVFHDLSLCCSNFYIRVPSGNYYCDSAGIPGFRVSYCLFFVCR